MSEPTLSPDKEGPKSSRDRRRSRRPRLMSRVRDSVWSGVDGILGADLLWSGALILLVILALGGQRCGHEYEQFDVGQAAPSDIKAFKDFEFVDALRTDEARQQAVDQVFEIYEYHTGRSVQLARQLGELFEQGRQLLQGAEPDEEISEEAVAREIGDRLSPAALNTLLKHRFDPALERDMTSVLTLVLGGEVVTN